MMYRYLFYLTTALLFLQPPTQSYAQNQEDVQYAVMSFNIRYENDYDGENSWSNRRKLVVSLIQQNRPDIAGLQEVKAGPLQFLDSLLIDYDYVGVGRNDGKFDGEFSPIFYLKEFFTVLESGTFWLSETPEKPSVGWDAGLPRIVTWAKMMDKRTDKAFLVMNTHMDNRGKKSKIESVRLIHERAKLLGENIPVILTGDFNMVSFSDAYSFLTSEENVPRFYDSRLIAKTVNSETNYTMNGFRIFPFFRFIIDYVFVSEGITVEYFEIIGDKPLGRYISDHYPVFVRLKI